MKKQQIKNYLKLGIFLFGISFFFVNCDKDDYSQNYQETKMSPKNKIGFTFKDKTYTELSQKSKFVNALDNVLKLKKRNIGNSNERTVMENQYGFTIDSTQIKEITSENYTSYTFLIHRSTTNQSFFENLVVTIDSTNTPKAYIIKYNLNSDPIYIHEDDEYALDSDTEITEIDYNVAQEKVSYTDGDGCLVTLMCPYGMSDHAAGSNCIDADRGDLFWQTDCPDSGGGGGGSPGGDGSSSTGTGSSGGGGGGSSSGPADPTYDPTDPANHGVPIITAPIIDDVTEDQTHKHKLLELSDHPKIKAKIEFLKTKLDENREYGFQFNLSGSNPIDYNVVDGVLAPDGIGIKFPTPTVLTVVEMHDHPNGTNNAFSGEDVYNMSKLAATNGTDNATAMLVTPNGTFALRVTDTQKATDHYNSYASITDHVKREKAIKDDYESVVLRYTNMKCAGTCTDAEFEEYLINYTIFYLYAMETGLIMYEAVEDNHGNIIGWEQIFYTP